MSVRSLTTSELFRRLMPTARGRIDPTADGSADAIVHCGAGNGAAGATLTTTLHGIATSDTADCPPVNPVATVCTVFQETFPNTEIMIMDVDEPACLVHAPNESVDPTPDRTGGAGAGPFLQTYPNPNR
ncbi:MAG: ylmB 2 [Dactylosporangium sp.]|jgi:hypothetical protein|nr:ylmB 2 [Dactylosporangium sp.]